MLADADRMAEPFIVSVVPAAGAKLPLPLITVSASTPLSTCTEPELAQGSVTVVVPVPMALRNIPALASTGDPEFMMKELPLACSSNVPLGALLNRPPVPMIWPAVHIPAPPFTTVPPANVRLLPLSIIPPLANAFSVEPMLPKVPPVQVNGPRIVMGIDPCKMPEEKFNDA